MQEYVEERTVAISVKAGKLSGRALAAACKKVLAEMKKHHEAAKRPHGRQSVKKLMNHYGTKSAMTLTTAKQAASNGYFGDDVLSVLRQNGYSDEMLRAIYGYEGSSTASAPTYSLSAGAQNLLSQLQSAAASSLNQEAKVNLISAALRNGKITEADANTLLNYVGY